MLGPRYAAAIFWLHTPPPDHYSPTERHRRRTQPQWASADDADARSAPQRRPRTPPTATPPTVAASPPLRRARRRARRQNSPRHDRRHARPFACQRRQRLARSYTSLRAHTPRPPVHAAAGLAPSLLAAPPPARSPRCPLARLHDRSPACPACPLRAHPPARLRCRRRCGCMTADTRLSTPTRYRPPPQLSAPRTRTHKPTRPLTRPTACAGSCPPASAPSGVQARLQAVKLAEPSPHEPGQAGPLQRLEMAEGPA